MEKFMDVGKTTKTKQQTYFEMMIARIYIKLSLVLPLKTSQMLDIGSVDIKNDGEVINTKWVDICKFEDMCSKKVIVPATIDRYNLYRDKINLS